MWADPAVQVGTLCHPIAAVEATNPNTVKVVVATNCNALHFSRAPPPFPTPAMAAMAAMSRAIPSMGVRGRTQWCRI